MIETTPNTFLLAERLRERIRHAGPMTFREWMNAALYDPFNGYYCKPQQNRWGKEGDYRTSPERSSLFAATFARYFARLYEDLKRPARWTIFEAGAGDGRFAEGVLNTLQGLFPQVFSATSYVIDEISGSSRVMIEERLQPFLSRVRFQKLEEIQLERGVVFCNELLDAFPVHRVTMRDGQLQEFFVSVSLNGRFEWLLDAPSTPRLGEYLEDFGVILLEGQTIEINLEIEEWLRKVAARMHSGYLVTVDYGVATDDLSSALANKQGSLRGFQRHQFVDDILARPGEHDLTTTVNWSYVKSVSARLGFEAVEFERQDRFLLAAGFLEQLALESQVSSGEAERHRLSTAAREMILPDGMASHFQVLVQKKSR
jgi:SAM-dependent MidA family methyltransferase